MAPEIQDTTGVGTHNSVAARVYNVLARLPGRNAGGPAVLLVAHYDGVPAAPAAGDDAAAVAALLETLRALRTGSPLAHDVIVLLSDGEESGLTGAAAFVREHPWAHDVAVVVNFEGRGTGGPSIMFETGPGNLDAVRTLRRVRGAVANSLSTEVFRQFTPNDSDLSELFLLGQSALNFGFADGSDRYHTAQDDVVHLDVRSVPHHGEQALALAREFGDGPLPRPRSSDAAFFTVLGFGIVVYPESFAMPLAIIGFVLVVAGCIRLRRRHERWATHLSISAAGMIVSIVLGVMMALVFSIALERILGGAPFGGPPVARGLYAGAIAMAALAVTLACWAVARRWASTAGAPLGALIVCAMALIVVTRVMPGASFLLLWPLLSATGAVLLDTITDRLRAAHLSLWIATVATAAVVVPVVYTVAVVIFNMGTPGAVMIGFVVPLFAWSLAPQLDALTLRSRSLAPAVALTSAVALFVSGAAIARQSGTRIQPSMLAYILDADTSNAWLASLPEFATRGSWGAAALGASPSLVMPRQPAAPDAPPEWLTRAIAGESRTLAVQTKPLDVGRPEVTIVSDQSVGQERRLNLRVIPAAGTYSIRLRATEAVVLSAAVDGRAIDTSRYRTPSPQWTLGYVIPPSDGFALTLNVVSGRPLVIDVIARSLGLPEPVRATTAVRPPEVVPIHSGDQTVVHRRFRF